MNSLLEKQEDKKVSPVLIVILIIILTVIASIVGFHAGKEEMRLEACNSLEFKCNPEDYLGVKNE